MNAIDTMEPVARAADAAVPARARPRRRALRVLAIVLAIPLLLLLALYVRLLFGPLPVAFIGDQVRAAAAGSMPENTAIELGESAIALEGFLSPVLQFADVVFTDRASAARVEMDALEIGFSPLSALLGRPGATVSLIGPRIQVIQDMFGPRLAAFEVVDDDLANERTVRVIQGEEIYPTVSILSEGLLVRGEIPEGGGLRSDNDWLVYNIEAGEAGMRTILEFAERGVFSSLSIRDGELQMHDAVYSALRHFTEVNLEVAPSRVSPEVRGRFSLTIGGYELRGTFARAPLESGAISLYTTIDDFNLSALMPPMETGGQTSGLVGTASVVSDILFDGDTFGITDGRFELTFDGARLSLLDGGFDIEAEPIVVDWDAREGRYEMQEALVSIGDNAARISSVAVLGMDDTYGPTYAFSGTAHDVTIVPPDLGPPPAPYEEMAFRGWAAPLYGAVGIDQFVASRGDMRMVTSGRIDAIRDGVGAELTVVAEGATADDLRRLWPAAFGGGTRDWFVENILTGRIDTSHMRFSLPVGALEEGEGVESAIDIAASGVSFRLIEGLEPLQTIGRTVLSVRDGQTEIDFEGAVAETDGGPLWIGPTTLRFGDDEVERSVFAVDGTVSGAFPALVALGRAQAPEAFGDGDLPLAPEDLRGNIEAAVAARFVLGEENALLDSAFDVSGTVTDFTTANPVEGRSFSAGALAFSIDNDGYRVGGTASLDGLEAALDVSGVLAPEPTAVIGARIDTASLAALGFDVSDFITGIVGVDIEPRDDGAFGIAVDLADAALSIEDLAISKPRGTAGRLTGTVSMEDDTVTVSDIALGFGTVRLAGSLVADPSGLRRASFTDFAISDGDSAQLSLAPIEGGYAIDVRGRQLDLKPLMGRFFSLDGGGTGGPRATSVENQTIALTANLDRALGHYGTAMFNVDVDLVLRGDDLRRVALQAQLGQGNAISITTNPIAGGRSMTVAFSELGTLLRFAGVYPRLLGGTGSLVLNTDTTNRIDYGEFSLRDFAISEEENVAAVLGNHRDSRALIAARNRIDLESARVEFIRRGDRIEVVDGVLDGGNVGGTVRGFIYTDAGQYDLTGTYVPLFRLSNAFQQIPIFGELLGGRDGEGLIGVTFAVRGPLDDPQFLVNPASMLVPGAFRSLFEYRTREQPTQRR